MMPERIENHMVVDSDYHIRKMICLCGQCGGNIYEQEDFYDFYGDIVCEACMPGYIKEHRRCQYE